MVKLREALKFHNIDIIRKRVKQLKQIDGEGWAIADYIEKQLREEETNNVRRVRTRKRIS
jgi:hypothetical protein